MKDLFKNLAFSILVVSTILLSVELALRVLWYSPSPPFGTAPRLPTNKDPVLGWRISLPPMTKTNPSYRILLLGDSFSYGLWGGVKEEERFSNVLNKMLGNEVEIINLGVPGYGTAQEYLLFTTEGYKYKPNMVILQFLLYDFTDNLGITTAESAKPIYTINENGQRIPVRIAVGGERISRSHELANKVEILRMWLNHNSSLYNFLRALHNKVGIFGIWHFKYKKMDLDLTLGLIAQLRERAHAIGVDRFVVAIVPHPQPSPSKTNYYYAYLQKFLEQEKIPYIYPKEEFIQNQSTFYNTPPVDQHFSVEGNKRFAEHLYKLIISLEPSLAMPQ